MITLLLLLNALVAIALVGAILLQRSEPGLGGAFGGGPNAGAGASSRNPLAKVTTYLAIIFMGSCLLLAVISQGGGSSSSLVEDLSKVSVTTNLLTEENAAAAVAISSTQAPAVPALPAPVAE